MLSITYHEEEILDSAKKFFEVRASVKASMNEMAPTELINLGVAGTMAVVGKEPNLSLAFYNFQNSNAPYATIGSTTIHINSDTTPGKLSAALNLSIITLEWLVSSTSSEVSLLRHTHVQQSSRRITRPGDADR